MGKFKYIVLCLLVVAPFCSFSQGASVNVNGALADPSAMLDVSSNNAGVLIPRMTESQKNLISAPATGLMIYQVDGADGFWYYDGTAWKQSLGVTGQTGASGAAGMTGPTGALLPGSAAGNTPYWDGSQWIINSSNIYNNGSSVGVGTNNPANSASLEVYGNTKGFLMNRLTTAERNAIASPVEGLQIFNTSNKCFETYINSTWMSSYCYGFTCGASTVSDADNNIYNTVLIGSQCWMKENLKTTKYRNGTAILLVTDNTLWANDVNGAYCCFNNDCATFNPDYGKMYNWYAVVNSNGLCPAGWHVPDDNEWCVMENYVEPGVDPGCNIWGARGSYIGGNLKETGTAHWLTPNTGAVNTTGFTALPGGYRHLDGNFFQINSVGYYWSNTEDTNDLTRVWTRRTGYNYSGSGKSSFSKPDGFSVRCIRD